LCFSLSICVYLGFCLPGPCRHIKDELANGGVWTGFPRLVRGTLLGTSTIIQCYPLFRAFLYPPPEDARSCQRVPARCPHILKEQFIIEPSQTCQINEQKADFLNKRNKRYYCSLKTVTVSKLKFVQGLQKIIRKTKRDWGICNFIEENKINSESTQFNTGQTEDFKTCMTTEISQAFSHSLKNRWTFSCHRCQSIQTTVFLYGDHTEKQ